MWKRILSVLLVLTFCLSLVPVAAGAEGDEPALTRGQWVHELVSLFGLSLDKDEYPDIYFPDIVESEYFDDIMVATGFGLISVEAGEDFRPDDPLTRAFAAQTLNYELGILNERDSYTFTDSEEIEFSDDAQVAVDQGWFALDGGKFLPDKAVTEAEKDAMLSAAGDILAVRTTNTNTSDYQFADYVKEIPESAAVESDFDLSTGARTVTISGYDGGLAANDTFVFYDDGFAFVFSAASVSQDDGTYTVVTKDAPSDAILKYEFQGKILPEVTEFIPDNSVVTLQGADGETITFGPVQVKQESVNTGDLASLQGIKLENNTISLTRDILISNGLKGELTGKISADELDIRILGNEKHAILKGTIDITSTIEFDALNDPAAKGLPLGGMKLGEFGYAGVELNLRMDTKIGYNYKSTFEIGFQYGNGNGSLVKSFKTSKDNSFSAEGTVSAQVSLSAYVDLGSMCDATFRIGAGPIMKMGLKQYAGGTPKRCVTTSGYLYAGAYVNVSFPDYKVTKSWDFYDEKNSPLRVYTHKEDGLTVSSCTRSKDPGTVSGSYYSGKYHTSATSRLFSGGTRSGSTGYGGYGQSEPVVIWETADNEDGTVTITKYHGNAGYLTIPETIDGKTVTKIGPNTFSGNQSIRVVTMGDTIKEVSECAFLGCSALNSIQFSKQLQRIASSVFQECSSLRSIAIPDFVTIIEKNAFRDCSSLVDISFGKEITEIQSGAFLNCTSLEEVILPDNLVTLGYVTFENCTSLKKVYIPASLNNVHTDFSWWSGTFGPFAYCSSLDSISFGEGITEIPSYLFACCTGMTSIEIPETVERIDQGAFSECSNLVRVKIPESVTTIDKGAFLGCTAIETIEIPDSVTIICSDAFRSCTALKNVEFGSNVTEIQSGAFLDCSALEEIKLPESLDTLGFVCFENCKVLKKVYIPASLKRIHTDFSWWSGTSGPFAYCTSLTDVTFGKGITTIPDGLFVNCTGIKDVSIPSTVTEIGASAFYECINLENITLQSGVLTIGSDAFTKTGIKSLLIPDTVISYGGALFQNCQNMSIVKLSKNVIDIPDHMFTGCTSLTTVDMPNGVEKIKYDTFNGCSSLTGLSFLPNTITSIETSAFRNCSGLTSAELPDLVSNLGNYAFQGCTALTSFKAGNDLLTIGNNCFQDCAALTNADLNDGLETIGGNAFQNCAALEKIVLPDTVSSLGSYVFQKDPKLTDVTLPASLTVIPAYAFANCTSLEQLMIPKGVTEIRDHAFYQDTKLHTFTIPASVTAIGENAFSYPRQTTVNGVAGSYAESYAQWQTFNDITKPADSITLASGKNGMTIGNRTDFTPDFRFTPEDSTDLVTLTSDDESVVSVKNGVTLQGKKKGSANVTATTSGGKSLTFSVTVDDASGIEVTKLPEKTEYNQGERKDRTGLIISQVFANGDREPVFDYQLSGFDTKTTGEKTITVTRNRQTAEFPITVAMERTGKMGPAEELTWTYSSKTDTVTVTGPVSPTEPVLAASYDKDGKLLSVSFITASGGEGKTADQARTVKLFWVDADRAPKCHHVTIG